jgi:tetratricopeptide (TPR) repeat protein
MLYRAVLCYDMLCIPIIFCCLHTLSLTHTHTQETLFCLGDSLFLLRRLEEAEPPLRECLAGLRVWLRAGVGGGAKAARTAPCGGGGTADLLRAVHGLARVLQARAVAAAARVGPVGERAAAGAQAEASTLFREALAGRRALLGDAHLDTLRSMHCYGVLAGDMMRFKEGQALLEECLAGRRRQLPAHDADTVETVQGLAYLYKTAAKFAAAKPLFTELLLEKRLSLGDDAPETLETMVGAAEVEEFLGRFDRAQELFREALEGRRRVLGKTHVDTMRLTERLAKLLFVQYSAADAESGYWEALGDKRRELGEAHPDTLHWMAELGLVLQVRDVLCCDGPGREGRGGECRLLYPTLPYPTLIYCGVHVCVAALRCVPHMRLYTQLIDYKLSSSCLLLADDLIH